MIEEFLLSEVGIIIISIIWGLGVATLFRFGCDTPACKVIEYRGPPIKDIKYKWKYGGQKCYNIEPYVTSCK
uniref:Uncharacterized protein n=1 Tax=viral metagenome TaxID=1070528 RepID=A0A6C0J4D9_9ZZZZ